MIELDNATLRTLNSDLSSQREMAETLRDVLRDLEDSASVDIRLFRARPVPSMSGTTRLLGQRGPSGRIIGGSIPEKYVDARFKAQTLRKWLTAWYVAHGSEGVPSADDYPEEVFKALVRYGLPARYHSLLEEAV